MKEKIEKEIKELRDKYIKYARNGMTEKERKETLLKIDRLDYHLELMK